MRHNYTFLDASNATRGLLSELLLDSKAKEIPSRAGATREMTHVGITLERPWRRELLVAERKPNLAAQVAETMWVLAGRSDIEWLGHYLPRAADFSDDGKVWRAGYGPRLRAWQSRGMAMQVDQLAYVVETLRTNPGSRQAVMSIWDPTVDTTPGKDIACNNWLSFIARNGSLDLMVAIRSNDAVWGWSGINQFEWSALLEIVAGLTDLNVGALHFAVTSFHLYEHHYAKARKIANAPKLLWSHGIEDSPRFKAGACAGGSLHGFDELCTAWFELEDRIRSGGDVNHAVHSFPEPMMRSWLRIIQWWWTGDAKHLSPLHGTRLKAAAELSVQPKARQAAGVPEKPRGGPWTRHGHAIQGVTVEGAGRPPVARCGGPRLCGQCAQDVLEHYPADWAVPSGDPKANVPAVKANVLADLLLLVKDAFPGPPPTSDEIASWTGTRREEVARWASAVHLRASDNAGVTVPPLPAVLADRGAHPLAVRQTVEDATDFISYVIDLHNAKHAAYGDSWKRRGEMLGIMANIARKIDRLDAGTETPDESAADTAVDLLVYLAKYRVWLSDPGLTEGTAAANAAIRRAMYGACVALSETPQYLTDAFTRLEDAVNRHLAVDVEDTRASIVEEMLPEAYRLAWARWNRAQGLSDAPNLGFVGGDHDLP